jgi:hypothetical protein
VNTDERIVALAQNLHLLGSIQRDFETEVHQFQTEVRQSLHVLTDLHRENEKRMAQMIQAITRLGHIAATHEDRLDLLEGK